MLILILILSSIPQKKEFVDKMARGGPIRFLARLAVRGRMSAEKALKDKDMTVPQFGQESKTVLSKVAKEVFREVKSSRKGPKK